MFDRFDVNFIGTESVLFCAKFMFLEILLLPNFFTAFNMQLSKNPTNLSSVNIQQSKPFIQTHY